MLLDGTGDSTTSMYGIVTRLEDGTITCGDAADERLPDDRCSISSIKREINGVC